MATAIGAKMTVEAEPTRQVEKRTGWCVHCRRQRLFEQLRDFDPAIGGDDGLARALDLDPRLGINEMLLASPLVNSSLMPSTPRTVLVYQALAKVGRSTVGASESIGLIESTGSGNRSSD
jgi:hypothetical protein